MEREEVKKRKRGNSKGSKRVKTEFFIANRISSRSAKENKNVMVRIATLTVAISMAVMIVSLAVIMGFKKEITDNLVGFVSHAQIVNLDGNQSFETLPIERNPEIEQRAKELPNFASINAYSIKGGVIKTDDAMEGVVLKGVEADYDWSFFRQKLTEGVLPTVGDSLRTKDILISQSLANTLQLGVGDRVEMLFVSENRPPRRDLFKISGLYNTGFGELDNMSVMTDMRNVQRLNRWDDSQITGYELSTKRFDKVREFSAELYRAVIEVDVASSEPLNLMVRNTIDQNPNLFDWLKAHNVNAAVVIIIMLLVALLNMISALLIIVLERTQMVGVLKALGMNNGALQRVFLIRSAYIVGRGLLWGNIVGIGACLIQHYTGVIKLNETGYFLSKVPISMDWGIIIGLNVGVFALILLLLAIPTMIVSKIKPDRTIRFQ